MLNKWGVAAILAMLAVPPVGFAVAALSGGNTPQSEFAALAVMVVAIACGSVASLRGNRWWLIVPVLATLWVGIVVLQMVVGE